ncbi:MAG TPA: hypothetical protein PLJ21_06875 [Pseudobdellovibrionaceae bacterium]|nr:hypothetical protein [Pseudobdellovibrionaceae bacterium]
MISIIFKFISLALAANTSAVEIYSVANEENKRPISQDLKSNIKKKSAHKEFRKPQSSDGQSSEFSNLPAYFEYHNISEIKSKIILSSETKQEKLMSIRTGDTVNIEINHSIIAFPDEKAPVVATIKSGSLIGAKVFGYSTLEKHSKRIFIEFERVSFSGSTYELKGSAITENGTQGFIGEYHSREGEYFAGDFISSFVAAYFDAQVPRSTNVFGQVQEDRSVDSAIKKGVAAGALSSADRFREKLKKTPEFSELQGPIRAQFLVYEGGQRL